MLASVRKHLTVARRTVRTLEDLEATLLRVGEHMGKSVGVGEALEGRVRAEVAATGELHDLALDPALLSMNPDDLSKAVLSAIQQATADARARFDTTEPGTHA
nr:YbaB/EbfC family nucleoid-associated protein [Actinopolymorpha pittospori]